MFENSSTSVWEFQCCKCTHFLVFVSFGKLHFILCLRVQRFTGKMSVVINNKLNGTRRPTSHLSGIFLTVPCLDCRIFLCYERICSKFMYYISTSFRSPVIDCYGVCLLWNVIFLCICWIVKMICNYPKSNLHVKVLLKVQTFELLWLVKHLHVWNCSIKYSAASFLVCLVSFWIFCELSVSSNCKLNDEGIHAFVQFIDVFYL